MQFKSVDSINSMHKFVSVVEPTFFFFADAKFLEPVLHAEKYFPNLIKSN